MLHRHTSHFADDAFIDAFRAITTKSSAGEGFRGRCHSNILSCHRLVRLFISFFFARLAPWRELRSSVFAVLSNQKGAPTRRPFDSFLLASKCRNAVVLSLWSPLTACVYQL